MTEILRVHEADERLEEAFGRLMPQLSASLAVPCAEELRWIAASPQTALFSAEEQGQIVGLLSLAWYDVPSGRHAWIEDVVVDVSCRGRGIGEALVKAGLDEAARIGADKVSLTSHPSRAAAHALYRRVGFEPYETTVFRLKMNN